MVLINNFKLLLILAFLFVSKSLPISVWNDLADYEAPEQKKFVFIICSCNNKNWYDQNLESAFSQEYPRDKFRFIYVDESRDGTADLVVEYVTAHNEWDRFTLIHNDTWQSVMHNHYKAVFLCQDDEIIVHFDGDDLLKHCDVLYLLNKVYNKWDVWLTYGQYEDWPNPGPGFSIDVPADIACRNEFRELGFWYSHPRTFYAWLFKKIKLKDLIWKGSFIPTTPTIDYMMMFPMIEMAGCGHYKFISDILYCYNRSNSLSTCNMPIKLEIPPSRSWEKYQPLAERDDQISNKRSNKHADIVIISQDEPQALSDLLISEIPKIKAIDTILILYGASTQEIDTQYQQLPKSENVKMINVNTCCDDCYSYLQNEYCVCITDSKISLNECDISNCIYELERTDARVFFFGLSKQSFKRCDEQINYGPFRDCQIDYRLAFLGNGIAAWQFGYEQYVMQDPVLFSAFLIKKNDTIKLLCNLRNDFTLNPFVNTFRELLADERDIGLLFE